VSAADEHRIKAEAVLRRLPDEGIGLTSAGAEATAHALLYVGDQLAQLVEQKKLANAIAALGTVNEATGPVLVWASRNDARDYIRDRIGDIVAPSIPESDPS
jgi:hypothetical protein